MSDFQEFCKKILPFVRAGACGEIVEFDDDGGFRCFEKQNKSGLMSFDSYRNYRIKPRTVKIGDFDVPEPMREVPNYGDVVFTVEIDEKKLFGQTTWNGREFVSTMLENGLLHKSKDAAISHAKAIIALTSAK